MLQLSRKKGQNIILDLRNLELRIEPILEYLASNNIDPQVSQAIINLIKSITPKTEFITITMCKVDDIPGYALIGIDAPRDVVIQREEIVDDATAEYIQQKKKRPPLLFTSYKSGISSP